MNPVILLSGGTSAAANGTPAWSLNQNYADNIRRVGGIPLLAVNNDCAEEYADLAAGLLLSGGKDVAPALYGEELKYDFVITDPLRDDLEWKLIKAFVDRKKPIFGICRGMQLANVAFGGNMIQDIPSQTKSVQAHVGSMDDRDEPFHWVDLKEDSVIRQLMGTDKIMTNSFHHQAVKDIARGFTVTGTAADGIAEAMECMDKKILCVQFHPENMAQRFGDFVNLFRWLVDNCQ